MRIGYHFPPRLGGRMFREGQVDRAGLLYAIASGAIASGLGYAIWYTALPALKSTAAATVQLSVPVLAAVAVDAVWRPNKVPAQT